MVAAASLAGVGEAEGSRGEGFLSIVSSVRGAAQEVVAPTPIIESVGGPPQEPVALLNRGAPAEVPGVHAPLPTPVPLNPNATPLPGPSTVALSGGGTAPTSRGAAPAPATGALVWPLPGGTISQYFHGGHLALDIAGSYGAQVLAAQSGVVVSAGWRNNGGGNVIEIDHGNGMRTLYNHLGSIWVSSGQYVLAGQGIGGNGCTGLCTGPHVHFQVIVNGVIDNPQRYF